MKRTDTLATRERIRAAVCPETAWQPGWVEDHVDAITSVVVRARKHPVRPGRRTSAELGDAVTRW